MEPVFTKKFHKQYQELPLVQQRKFDKQLKFLLENHFYPSLRTRKMAGLSNFEARVDHHYRFTFQIVTNEVWLMTVGPHDEGLGKK